MSNDNETESSHQYDAPAARYAIRALELLGNNSTPLALTDIALGIDTNKHMAMRILHVLEEQRWIHRRESDARYELTLRPLHFMGKAVNQTTLNTAAQSPMDHLAEQSRCLVVLMVLDDNRSLCVAKREQNTHLRVSVNIGERYPLHNSAPGKAMLAWDQTGLRDRLVAEGLNRATEQTIVDPIALDRELEAVRQNGFAVDRQEGFEGLVCLAAPIFDYENRCVAALGISSLTSMWPEDRFFDKLTQPVIDAAQQISETLGAQR